ncbi:MAG TPA: hypothetical protein VJ761_24905 [Ktedonobacteraceae bacterium]|nr:hypothetical protein [Ktedonobacteraceae bacterium]
MRIDVEQARTAQARASQMFLADKAMQHLDAREATNGMPKVMIKGDIRLRVTTAVAAHRPIKGSYRIDLEQMQEPLQVIWITEGKVIGHSVHNIDIEFDLRGVSAGETRTFVVSAHVTDRTGQGRIIHSSVFVQILVIGNELLYSVA